MRNANTKVDGVDSMPAANYNAQRDELENAVTSTDQTLDPDAGPDTDLNMLGKAMAAYANAGNVYQDSGVADAYVLSITTNLKTVTKYYDNMMVMFKVGATNTGASTVNVNTLGVKSLTLSDGTALAAGNITAGRYVLANYSLSNDRFELVTGAPASSLEYNIYIHATDGDYPTLASYLAAAPVAGDSVLYDTSETIASTFTIPDNIAITFVYGSVFVVSSNAVSPAFSIGSNIRFDSRVVIQYTNAGIQVNMIQLNGSNNGIDDILIQGTASGTITTAVKIEAGKIQNRVNVDISPGTLTVTTPLDDSSGIDNNLVIVTDGTTVYRSAGASDFGAGVFTQDSGIGVNISALPAQIASTGNLSVTAGDLILVHASGSAVKGGTGGTTSLKVDIATGTATILSGDTDIEALEEVAATNAFQANLFGLIKVTATGTLRLDLEGISGGSDSTVNGYIGVSFLRRQ